MTLNDDVLILYGVRLFEDLTQEQLRILAFGVEHMHIQAGEILYSEGETANDMFIIIGGMIELYREIENKNVSFGTVGPGAVLGELALIAGSNRLTGAVAVEDSRLLRLGRNLFQRILQEYPEVAVMLYERISSEFQFLVRDIEKLLEQFEPKV